MPTLLLAYPFVIISILVLDALWLGLLMKDFYREHLGYLMGPVVWSAAILLYILLAAGLTYFAVMPGIEAKSLLKTLVLGAALGAVAYATYDLTNHAIVKDWPLIVTVVDIAWGAVLCGAAASAGYLAVTAFSEG